MPLLPRPFRQGEQDRDGEPRAEPDAEPFRGGPSGERGDDDRPGRPDGEAPDRSHPFLTPASCANNPPCAVNDPISGVGSGGPHGYLPSSALEGRDWARRGAGWNRRQREAGVAGAASAVRLLASVPAAPGPKIGFGGMDDREREQLELELLRSALDWFTANAELIDRLAAAGSGLGRRYQMTRRNVLKLARIWRLHPGPRAAEPPRSE